MKIVKTTDGKFLGSHVEEVARGAVLELCGYSIPIVFVFADGELVVAGNPNYVITFEQE